MKADGGLPAAAIGLVGRGAAVQLAGNILVAISGLIATAFAVRLLPPLQYGVLALALASLTIFSTLLWGSFDVVTTRAIAAAHARRDVQALLMATRGATTIGIAVSALGGAIVSIVLVATQYSTEPFERAILLIALPLTIVGRTAAVIAQWFARGVGALRFLVLPTAGMALILVMSFIALLVAGRRDLAAVTLAFALAASFGIAMAILVSLRVAHGLSVPLFSVLRPSLVAARHLVLASGPYAVGGLSAAAINQLDVFVLGLSHGPGAVAQYEPVLRLVDGLLSIIPGALTFFFPAATWLYLQRDLAGFRALYLLVSKYAFAAGFGVLLVLLISPESVVRAVYGPAYVLKRELIWILLVGHGVNIALGLNLAALASTGRTDAILWTYSTGIVAMVVFVGVLVPAFGASGAAAATTLSLSTLNISASVWLYRTSGAHLITRSMLTVWTTAAAAVAVGLIAAPTIPSGTPMALALPVAVWGLWATLQFVLGSSSVGELRLLGTRRSQVLVDR